MKWKSNIDLQETCLQLGLDLFSSIFLCGEKAEFEIASCFLRVCNPNKADQFVFAQPHHTMWNSCFFITILFFSQVKTKTLACKKAGYGLENVLFLLHASEDDRRCFGLHLALD